jgi:hypothetical protein
MAKMPLARSSRGRIEEGPMTEMESRDPVVELDALIERASAGTGKVTERLSPGDEDQAAAWLRALLVEGGKAGLEQALDRMLRLPWVPGVKGVVAAWPELKVTGRRALLKGFADAPADLRFRLSLSRGLHPTDAETATKLVVTACKEVGPKPDPAARGVFAGVMIGRGRPWILAFPLSELKPAEARAVADAVLACAFPGGFPPQTHVNLLKWLAAAGLLADLDEAALAPVLDTARRWSHRVQSQARAELGDAIPAALAEALASKPAAPATPALSGGSAESGEPLGEAEPSRPADADDAASPAESGDTRGGRQPQRSGRGDGSRGEPPHARRPGPPERMEPGRTDPIASLRRVTDQVIGMQRELDRMRAQLAQRDDRPRRGARFDRAEEGPVSGESVEALQRRNAQLEETVAELKARLEDLAAHDEDVATSMRAHADAPAADALQQMRSLIGIKLARQYAEFRVLRDEPDDVVLRQHYREMLALVFDVLTAQGVEFPDVEV